MSLAADGYESEKGRNIKKKKATPFLDEFGEDLTALAESGNIRSDYR